MERRTLEAQLVEGVVSRRVTLERVGSLAANIALGGRHDR